MKDLTLSIVLNLSTENIVKGLKNFKILFQKSLKETEKTAKVSSKEMDEAFATLGMKSLEQVRAEVQKLKLAYDTLKKSGKLSAQEQAKAQIQLKKKIQEVESELNGWAKNLSSIKDNWLELIGLFAGAGYTLKQVTGTFVEFDDVMRQVAAVSGANQEQFQQMTALAREMGATTKYSASEAAGALKNLAMAGFGVEKSMKALPEVLNLASATATDLATSADIVTNIMSQYSIEAEKLSHVNDVLVKATTSTNSNLIQLGYAFSYAGSIAKTVGLSFEETVAILGQLHNAGIKGERAGTALRGALSHLLNPSEKAKKVFKELGVSIYDSTGKMRPFLDILSDLSDRGAAAADIIAIFGQEAGPGIQALLNMGVNSIRTLKKTLEDSAGVAKKASEQMSAGLGGSLRELRSSIEELQIALGEELSPALISLTKTITFIVRGLGEMDSVSKGLVGAFTVAVGATIAWRLGLSKLYNSFVLLRAQIIATTGATRLLVGAMGALTAIWSAVEVGRFVYELVKYKEAMEGLAEASKRYAEQAKRFEADKKVEIKTMEELQKMSKEEAEAYKQRLVNAMRYWNSLASSLVVQKEERNILLQKTDAAKKAEEAYKEVSQKANEYLNAVIKLNHASRQMAGETGAQNAVRAFREQWIKSTEVIKEQTKAMQDQANKLKEAYQFRVRLAMATESDEGLERKLLAEKKAYYNQILALTKEYYTKQSKELDVVLEKEKQIADSTAAYQEQILRKKIEVANQAKRVLLSALEEALQAERRYAQEVANFSTQITNAQINLESELRALRRTRMTEEEQIADKLEEAEENRLKAKEELEKKNYDLAKRYAEMAKALYAEVARSSKDKFEDAYEGVAESGNLYVSILEKQKEEAQKKWEEQKKLTESLRDSIKELNEDLKQFTGKLSDIPEERKTKILFESEGLTEIKDQYDNIKDKDVYVTVHQRVVEEHQTGGVVGLSMGGKLPGFGGGDRIRALLEAGEFVIRKEAVRKYGVGLLSAINNMKFNLPSFPVPNIRQIRAKQETFPAETYRKFEINMAGARLEGFAMKDIIDNFEKALRRRKLCGA